MLNNNRTVQVAARIRPPCQVEDQFVNVHENDNLVLFGKQIVTPRYDYVFGPSSTQEEFFTSSVKCHLDNFIRGEHFALIVYGPSLSGKSYSLFGPGVHVTDSLADYGILPRVATYIFSKIEMASLIPLNQRPKIKISIFEVYERGLKDLLNPWNLGPFSVYRAENGEKHMMGLRDEYCGCPSDMISFLQHAMAGRQLINSSSHSSSVVVRLTLEHYVLYADGIYRFTKTFAQFAEVASTSVPCQRAQLPNGMVAYENLDIYILELIVKWLYGEYEETEDSRKVRHCEVLSFLWDSFTWIGNTLVLCCIPPSSKQTDTTHRYLSVATDITNLISQSSQNVHLPDNSPYYGCLTDAFMGLQVSGHQQLQTPQLSQADCALSCGSRSSEEITTWVPPRAECEENHIQLECIEEVTESEEELASSNEKMSESHPSVDNSPCESDQDDGENKNMEISSSDFFVTLEHMCTQFNMLVDNTIHNFKTDTIFSPAKESKRRCSAARRGGLSFAQKENANINTDLLNQPLLLPGLAQENLMQNYQVGLESPHNRDVSRHITEKNTSQYQGSVLPLEKDKKIEAKEDEDKYIKTGARPKRAITNVPKVEESNVTMKENASVPLTSQRLNDEQGILSLLDKEEKRFIELKKKISDFCDRNVLGRCENIQTSSHETIQSLIQILVGVSNFLDMAHDITERDLGKSPEENKRNLEHRVREFRRSKEEFRQRKSKYNKKIKEKTYTDDELRDYIISDEIIEALDFNIEYVSRMKENKSTEVTLNDSLIGTVAMYTLKTFTITEIRYLLYCYFRKVVDLRESGKTNETLIAEQDAKLDWSQSTIANLNVKLAQTRKYFPPPSPRELMPYQHGSRPPPQRSTLNMPEEASSNPQVKPRSMIPQQNLSKLQVETSPRPTVTYEKGKLIIKSNCKEKN